MDIDATGKIRCFAVFQPEVVSEPRVLGSDGNQITGARVVDGRLDLPSRIQDAGHAGRVFEQGDHFGFNRAIVDVNVRYLMVGDGEDFAGTAIDHFQPEFVLDHDPPFLAKEAVEMNRPIHVCDGVFREQQYFDRATLKKRDQVADDGVDLLKVPMNGGVDRP